MPAPLRSIDWDYSDIVVTTAPSCSDSGPPSASSAQDLQLETQQQHDQHQHQHQPTLQRSKTPYGPQPHHQHQAQRNSSSSSSSSHLLQQHHLDNSTTGSTSFVSPPPTARRSTALAAATLSTPVVITFTTFEQQFLSVVELSFLGDDGSVTFMDLRLRRRQCFAQLAQKLHAGELTEGFLDALRVRFLPGFNSQDSETLRSGGWVDGWLGHDLASSLRGCLVWRWHGTERRRWYQLCGCSMDSVVVAL